MNEHGEGQARALLDIDADVRGRVIRLAPEAEAGQSESLFARAVWSRLVEPGDAVAGALVSVLGPVRALELLLASTAPRRVCEIARAEGAFESPPGTVAKAFARWRLRLDRAASIGDLDRALDAGMSILAPGSPHWPSALDDLGRHAPLLLWTRGDASQLSAFSVAVVGARACTGYGAGVTAEFTEVLCSAGAVIVSGAAYGIDAVAHRTALAVGSPTVAVLAGGADRAYPSSHGPLLTRIAEAGAVCSEMVPGAAPTRWRFLQRNRTIAALSRATLVTEAGMRSGSLNTAGHAAELGRPLGAVPGAVTSSASAGCHRLIRDYGAALVTNETEVREFAGLGDDLVLFGDAAAAGSAGGGSAGSGGSGGGSEGARQPALHRRVLDALPLRGARDLPAIARLAGVDEQEARGALAELELLGAVARRETPDSPGTAWVLERRT